MNFYGILAAHSDQCITKIIDALKAQDIQLELDPAKSEQKCLEKLELKPTDILIIYHHPPIIDALRLIRSINLTHFLGKILVITLPTDEKIANQSIVEGAFAYFIDTSDNYQAIPYLVKRMLNDSRLSHKDTNFSLSSEEKLKVLEHFTSYISHELKNSFTTIHNALYFLKKKISENTDPIFQKYIHIIQNEMNNSNKFLSNLVTITQKKLINVSTSQVNDILQEAVHKVPLSKKINIIFQLDPCIPVSLIDPEQIQIVFLHIIRNAIQAMPEGGNITLQTAYKNKTIEIHIIDHGIGIEKDYLPQIFDVFFTTKTRNVGLGLTFSKIIIESHGGQIYFNSAPGQGTQCTIILPQRT